MTAPGWRVYGGEAAWGKFNRMGQRSPARKALSDRRDWNDTRMLALKGGTLKGDAMKKLLAITTTALIVVGFTAGTASAKKYHRHHKPGYGMSARGATGFTGGNAAMSGNNGNSASGSNSLGHIKGGNIGGGK